MFIYYFVDINECVDGTHNCGDNEACNDINGSFICTCPTGLTRLGDSCVGKYLQKKH